MYTLLKPLYYLLKPFDGLVTDTESLGKAMISIASKGSDKRILEMKDISPASKS
jgi:hypothetical protein